MAVQAFPYLVMTDGTDTVTFANGLGTQVGVHWPPIRGQWAPSIAGIRTSLLGGRGPYVDVEEDLSCNIVDTTAALCWDDLDTLVRLLDKAERWWLKNEAISPVLLKYAPQGSILHSIATPLQALVLGRVGSDELNGTELPQNVNDAGFIFQIHDVRMRCIRRGAWTGTVDTIAASGAAANTTVITQTWSPTHPISSPFDLTIAGFDKTATPTIKAGYLCVGSNVNDIQVLEAEGATAAKYTSVADAAALARGGSVLRYTPTDALPATSGTLTFSTPALTGPLAIIAAVRNNHATTTWQVQANVSGLAGAVAVPVFAIDASTLLPRQVLLGTVVGNALNKITFTVTASAAAGTLDIDYIIVVNLRDETVAVIAHDDISLANLSAGAVTLEVANLPTRDRVPTLYGSGNGGLVYATYRGGLPIQTIGANFYVLWTATNGAFWRFTNTSNAILNVTAAASRYRSYLSPR